MSTYKPTQSEPFDGTQFSIDEDAGTTLNEIRSSSGNLREIHLDNRRNGLSVYLKVYDAASGSVTLGVTVPKVIVRALPGKKFRMICPMGIPFTTAITYACVTTGGTTGTTAPPYPVTVKLETIAAT